MLSRRILACALALANGAPVRAAEAPARPALRWADVLTAVERDPRLAAARSRARAADAAISAAASIPNPELELGAGRARAREGGATRGEWELALTLPLEWLARRGAEVAAAGAGADEAQAAADALRAEVRAELWRRFVEAGYAQAEVDALMETEAQVSALAALVRRRVEAGEGRPVEIPRVELDLERVRSDVEAARAARDAALAQLAVWLGAPIDRVELPASPPPVPEPWPPGDLARHPRLRAALARVNAARAEAVGAHRARIPAVSIGAYYASELDREAAGGRLTVELPLWNPRRGQAERAEANAEAAASQAEAERRALAAELAEARIACGRARDAADREATRVLPRAEAAARTLERTFQLGEIGILDVLDARRLLLDARRAALSSARERDLACGSLILVSGRELP